MHSLPHAAERSFEADKRRLESMRSVTPQIEGLSKQESLMVYAGDAEPLIAQLRLLDDRERDRTIMHIASAVGRTTRMLSEAGLAHEEEYGKPEKAAPYFEACARLCRFLEQLYRLYQLADQPSRFRNHTSD